MDLSESINTENLFLQERSFDQYTPLHMKYTPHPPPLIKPGISATEGWDKERDGEENEEEVEVEWWLSVIVAMMVVLTLLVINEKKKLCYLHQWPQHRRMLQRVDIETVE